MAREAGAGVPAFQIQFPLFGSDYGTVAFPCDVAGNVDLNRLSDAERCEYFFAKVMAHRVQRQPRIVCVSEMA